MTIQEIIENKLKATQKCGFKKAFIPKGWACVNIKSFSKELSREITGGRKYETQADR